MQNTPPYHTPLVKFGSFPNKSKYKFITFLETQLFDDKIDSLSKLIDKNLNSNEYPVFLLSLADLLDQSNSFDHLIQNRSDSSYIIAQNKHLIKIALSLKKFHQEYLKLIKKGKHIQTPYQFLMCSVEKIKTELQIPIILFCPPNPTSVTINN